MAQRCEGKVCPSHTLAGWVLQEPRNSVPTAKKEQNPVSGEIYRVTGISVHNKSKLSWVGWIGTASDMLMERLTAKGQPTQSVIW